MKRSIAFIIPTLTLGGGEKLTLDLAQELSKYLEVSIILLKNNIQFDVPSEINVILTPPGNIFRKTFYVSNQISQLKFQVVISVMEQANFFNSLLSKLNQNYQPVYSVHTPPKQGFANRTKLRQAIISITYRFLIPNFANFIAVSEGVKEELESTYRLKNITRIYNPINIDQIKRFSQEQPSYHLNGYPKILTVGRLVSLKGHSNLINAFSIFSKKNPHAKLYIIGDGPEYNSLSQQISDLKLENSITLLGEVKNPFPYYLRSDLYLCSSKFEGFGLTLLEAMACNLPVASLDCNYGPREILKRNNQLFGFLSKPSDHFNSKTQIRLLLDLMSQAFSNESIYQEYKSNLKLRTSDFDIQTIGKEYLEYINGLTFIKN